MSEYLTSSQAARLLGVARSTFHNWHISGKLEEYGVHAIQTLGGHYRYRREEIEALRDLLLSRARRSAAASPNGHAFGEAVGHPEEGDYGAKEPASPSESG
ncbi:hypothetical protein Tmar_0339 [Thermaerobacter marianensis DSM 12885]|uniref:Helix-turn-helix domain-containing protein n=1 Tax=Thermaerobacter marianensis (strain ATCC 700841 / DSM 12885 / JCM 10246 / 7p75a) TaxID=644966 RepID=E6SG47_THEM7|nr:helix-turn-helix domain-containing protein [Thermaerobacter marianensis]ADU50464.1 hypothetical protein Tmar_0339 [Thermaerobacter marianensis DSM 12885]